MAKQRVVDTHFWDDQYTSELDPIEKLLFLYFITNPLTNIAGCYEIRIKQIAFDTGIDKDMVLKILERFEKDKKIIYIPEYNYVVLANWDKHQTLNDSVLAGIKRIIQEETPKEVLKLAFTRLGTGWGVWGLLNSTQPNLTKPSGSTPANFQSLQDFTKAIISDSQYSRFDMKYYYEEIKNHIEAKNLKVHSLTAYSKKWMLKDLKDGKAVFNPSGNQKILNI